MMIEVVPGISLDEREFTFRFVQSDGPGGQNVNKVATAVELRFDAGHTSRLTPEVRTRLLRLAGSRASADGMISIVARRYRSQEANRLDAIRRLVALVQHALLAPKQRRATHPSRAAHAERIAEKRHRGVIKQHRRSRPNIEDEE